MVRRSGNGFFVERLAGAADLAALEIPPGFGSIVRSAELRPVLQHILELGGTVTAALRRATLVGYVTDLPFVPVLWPGGRIERRWEELPRARELGSLEVAAPFRNRGVAQRMMASLASGGRLEPYIVVGEALSWHWDLVGTGQTDEPEVAASGANFLVARIGCRTSEEDLRGFQKALYR